MVFILLVKKKHPSHIGHVKIDLSKMTQDLFGPYKKKTKILPKFSIWKTKNYSSVV
jgi:hypothetical protein